MGTDTKQWKVQFVPMKSGMAAVNLMVGFVALQMAEGDLTGMPQKNM